jgi:hypothetical protein
MGFLACQQSIRQEQQPANNYRECVESKKAANVAAFL